jgi:hypothetical protein
VGFKTSAGDNSRVADELHRSLQDARVRRFGIMTVLLVACSIALLAQETTGTNELVFELAGFQPATMRGIMLT